MGILQDFERRLEGAVEGFFGRLFRSNLQPVELAKALQRYADDHRLVAEDGVVVPNAFRITLSDKDATRLSAYGTQLAVELGEVVERTASERGWKLRGAPQVHLESLSTIRVGMFDLAGRVDTGADASATPSPSAPGKASADDADGRPRLRTRLPAPGSQLPTEVAPDDQDAGATEPASAPARDDGMAAGDRSDGPDGTAADDVERHQNRLEPAGEAVVDDTVAGQPVADQPVAGRTRDEAADDGTRLPAPGTVPDPHAANVPLFAPVRRPAPAPAVTDEPTGDEAPTADEASRDPDPTATPAPPAVPGLTSPSAGDQISGGSDHAPVSSAPRPVPAALDAREAAAAPATDDDPATTRSSAPSDEPATQRDPDPDLAPSVDEPATEAASAAELESARRDLRSLPPVPGSPGLVVRRRVIVEADEREVELIGARLVLGRVPTVDVQLDDGTVSREHAALVKRGDAWWVVDLGSTNGTRVNGVVGREHVLRDGDRIELGEVALTYREG